VGGKVNRPTSAQLICQKQGDQIVHGFAYWELVYFGKLNIMRYFLNYKGYVLIMTKKSVGLNFTHPANFLTNSSGHPGEKSPLSGSCPFTAFSELVIRGEGCVNIVK
jgi:hypothetical protein